MDVIRDPNNLQMAAAAAPLLALAGSGALQGIRSLREARDKARTYQDMLRLHPGLTKEKPEEVKRTYSTLQRFGPGFAQDPLVAGAWVREVLHKERSAEFSDDLRGRGTMQSVQDLVRAQADIGRGGRGGADLVSSSTQLGRLASDPIRAYADYRGKLDTIDRNVELEKARDEAEIWRRAYLKDTAAGKYGPVAPTAGPAPRQPRSPHNIRKTAAEILRRHR
jgi:hypothetical protein